MKRAIVLSIALAGLGCKSGGGTPAAAGSEHPGAEHPGSEHPGKEHPGAEHPGGAAKAFTAVEIKTAMQAHIEATAKAGGGTFMIKDDQTGETLNLKFVTIHDPVRKIEGKGYFACSDFQPASGEPTKLYDLDFWLNPKEGKLIVTETKIHKHPEQKGGKWEKVARYTFVADNPVEVQ